jgi:hypothetical protein
MTFFSDQCVVEDFFINGSIARFWFKYNYNESDNILFLEPTNDSMKRFYKKSFKELKLLPSNSSNFTVFHSENRASHFKKKYFICLYEKGDQAPIKPIKVKNDQIHKINQLIDELYL